MPAFYIVLQEKIPGVDSIGLEGRALSKHNLRLEALAKQAGVTPLVNFFSASENELAALLEDHLIPDEALSKAKELWFSPEEGLRTIEELLRILAQQPSAENSALGAELMEFQRVLQAAQSRNIRWHLAIDY